MRQNKICSQWFYEYKTVLNAETAKLHVFK